MFETRKILKNKVSELEKEVELLRLEMGDFVSLMKANIHAIEGPECVPCIHCKRFPDRYGGFFRVCTKDVKCKDICLK